MTMMEGFSASIVLNLFF